jgi:VWFA-related protein
MKFKFLALLASVTLLAFPLTDHAQQTTQEPVAPAQPQKANPPQVINQQPPNLIFNVNLVDVLATVLDRRNKLVPDLDQKDFKITDDNTNQEIRFFSKQSDLPLRIGMLLDTSNSIRDRIKFEQEAAVDFLYSVLRRGKDQAFAMTFDDEPQIIQAFTGDGGLLRDEINKTRAGGGTAVYDAIYEACAKELSNPPRPPGDQPDVVRRVMVLISDGDDNLSNHTRAEAIEMAQRTNVVIYTISTSTQWIQLSQTDPSKAANRKMHLTDGDEILKDIAEETGGRAFFPYHVDDLNQSFQDIGDELRNQYTITYSPTNFVDNGKYHRIKIEIPNHNGYQVRLAAAILLGRAPALRRPGKITPPPAERPHRCPSLDFIFSGFLPKTTCCYREMKCVRFYVARSMAICLPSFE